MEDRENRGILRSTSEDLKEEILLKLAQLYKEELGVGPFPTRQTYEVGQGKDYAGFHASLTLYLASIAGIASHGKQLKKISSERKLEFRRIAAQSFFAKHPEFGYIEQRIQSSDVPDLKRRLEFTEQARQLIVEVLAEE